MSDTIASDNQTAVLGLGVTGRSCVRYLVARGQPFDVFDTGISEAAAAAFRREHPGVRLFDGPFDSARLSGYRRLLISPGIALDQPAIQAALAAGAKLVSDIDLARAEIQCPVIGITGSNGKTTVTTLVGLMARRAGLRAAVVGNIGEPVLDALLSGERYDVYVIELSSFQLERSAPLGARAATILNVSPDHMDRYANLLSYQQAKQAIYRACEVAVFNRDDKLTSPLLGVGQQSISFGSGPPDLNAYGLVTEGQAVYLARGSARLLDCREMKIHGSHNQLNALAALALGEALALPQDAMLAVLREFPGVSHRCQWVAEHRGVRFFDDSKATNVGATLAALRGLSQRPGDVVLIAGGVGKGADFAPLLEGVGALKALVLLGEAAAQIAAVFQGRIDVVRVGGMAEAVKAAAALATTGDIVLLAPACASFDMYADYAARGDDFARQVALHLGEVG